MSAKERWSDPVPLPPNKKHAGPAYMVSTLGRLRVNYSWGGCPCEWRPLNPVPHHKGYLVLRGGWGRLRVHRAVLLAFVGPPPPDKPLACHNNGVPGDNRLANLRWDSLSGNRRDMIKHGTHDRGARNSNALLSNAQAMEIRRRRLAGALVSALARRFRVSRTCVYNVVNGKTYKEEYMVNESLRTGARK